MDTLLTIELTRTEKDLLLNDLDIGPEISGKLRLLAQKGNTITVKLTRAQMEKMVDVLDEAAQRTTEPELEKAYRDLSAKMERAQARG